MHGQKAVDDIPLVVPSPISLPAAGVCSAPRRSGWRTAPLPDFSEKQLVGY